MDQGELGDRRNSNGNDRPRLRPRRATATASASMRSETSSSVLSDKIDNKKKKVQSRTRSAPNKTKAQTKSKSKKKKKNNHTSTRKRSKPTKTSGGGANNSDDSFDSGDNNESDSDGSDGSDEDDSNSEPWFAIKDIIGEKKLKKGKVYYLVQWEGIDPDTGEAYEPTWEPEDNVTEVAIASWRDKEYPPPPSLPPPSPRITNVVAGNPSQHSSTEESNPVLPTNWRRKKRDARKAFGAEDVLCESESVEASASASASTSVPKRARRIHPPSPTGNGNGINDQVGGADEETGEIGVAPPQAEQIEVVLSYGSSFDPAEYLRISSQQSSQLEHSQLGHSQLEHSQLEHSQQEVSLHSSADQRVIPDSQELSDFSNSTQHNSAPQQGRDHHLIASQITSQVANQVASQVAGQIFQKVTTSTSEIPSHQPDPHLAAVVGSQTQNLLSTTTEAPSLSLSSSSSVAPHSQQSLVQKSCRKNSSHRTNGNREELELLTQVPFESDSVVPTPRSSSHNGHNTFAPSDCPVQSNSHNSNQALSELDRSTRSSSSISKARELESPVQAERASQSLPASSSESRATGRNSPGRVRHIRAQTVSSPVQPATASDRRFERRSLPPSTMDDMASPSTKLSARERLRRIREQYLPDNPSLPIQSSSALNPPTASDNSPSLMDHTDPQPPVEPNAQLVSIPDISDTVASPALPIIPLEEEPSATLRDEQPSGLASTGLNNELQHTDSISIDMGPVDMTFNEPPATLDPSNLTMSVEERDISPSIPTDDALAGSVGPDDGFIPSVDSPAQLDDELPQESSGSHLIDIPIGTNEHLITLPFFASGNGREQYNNIIRENEAAMKEYNSAFIVTPYRSPAPSVTAAIDRMFASLFDFCDYPPFLETALGLGDELATKHAVGTNAKFCFVDEFLLHLHQQESSKKILILVKPGGLLDLLCTVVRTRGYHLIRSGQWMASPADSDSSLIVAVHATSEDPSLLPKDVDAIIAFDHTYREGLLPPSNAADPPLVLLLTNANSIQHINMRVSENMEPLERKNYLMLTLIKAMRYIEEPDYSMRKPDEVAHMFADYLEKGDNDDFYWAAQDIPDDIFENIHEASSQIQLSQHTLEPPAPSHDPGSRKRSHDELEESAPKRTKMSQAPVVGGLGRISTAVWKLLGNEITDGPNGTINVPADRLEALATKVERLTTQLAQSKERENEYRELSDRTKKEVDEHKAWFNKTQLKFMDALKDRGTYESECKAAQEKAEAVTTALESARKENETLKDTNAELKKKLSEANESLLNSSVPVLKNMAQLEKDLEAAVSEVQKLEKSLKLAQGDLDYVRNAYQQATQSAGQLQAKNSTLAAEVKELERKANDNVVKVNQTQDRQEVAELSRLLADQRAVVRDREAELNRLREEVRSLRASRRETRGSSVPRSPRLGSSILSPRNNHQSTTPSSIARGATSSRAASPAAGAQQLPPMGVFDAGGGGAGGVTAFFGRHAHLRD